MRALLKDSLLTGCSRAVLCARALALFAGCVSFGVTEASANPTGGAVSAGSAGITSSGNTLTVSQSSSKAVINWTGFDIAAGETTQFVQPSSSAVALNRVNSSSASRIDGNLTANGDIVLINQNGVVFGAGAKVDVNGLVVSTANISDGDFMNATGPLSFNIPGNPNAAIVNNGSITAAQAGLVGLVAPSVINNGVITAKLGRVQLASGDTATVDLYGDGLMEIAVSPQVQAQLVANNGIIQADGGAIQLTAAAGSAIVNSLISNTGTLQAQSAAQANGVIYLYAQGSNADIAMSGTINANGGTNGNGGTVSIKAGGNTDFSGLIEAEGGTESGNGGTVETSGSTLAVTGRVITTAQNGLMGMWLLDPAAINIITGGGSSLTGSTIDPSYIVTGLNGSNITLTAATSITVTNAIDASGNASTGNLILNAATDYLNAAITLKGASTLSGDATTVNVGASGLVQNGVDAAAAGGTVNLAAATYALSSEITIGKNLTLNGDPTSGSVLNGQNSTRVMEIDGTGGGITVNLNRLTMENGNGTGTYDTGLGGGLFVDASNETATVNINNSTIAGNSASEGGGISNYSAGSGNSTMTINNSTISGNSTSDLGGGILSQCLGNTTITITNSTISGNTAGAGGGIYNREYSGSDELTINNSTISGNSVSTGGGGIYDRGGTTLTISDTILAGNTVSGSESDYVTLGGATLTSNGYNLYGQNGTDGGFGSYAVGSDIELSGLIGTVLSALANNGGPTETLALVASSPAIAAGGANSGYEIDQRGMARNSTVSIGAYEYNSPGNPFIVTSTSDTAGTNLGQLRTALNYADNNPAFDPTITFNSTDFASQQTITLTQGELTIGSSLTLTGPSAGVILNANNASRVMEIDGTSGGITVNLSNLTMENGSTSGAGGGLLITSESSKSATVNISDSTISGDSAGGSGGGILNDGQSSGNATLTINNSTISGNSALGAYGGGGIYDVGYLGSATATITNSTISGNTANGNNGGGIFNNYGTVTIGNTILAGNSNGSESDYYTAGGSGTLTSLGYNLYGQSGNAGGFVPATHDVLLAGNISTVLNTTLANNGGPTETLALVANSPAIGAGDPAQIGLTDQRGIVRGSSGAGTGSASDIGAYEAAIIDVSAGNQEIIYGQSAPAFTYTVTAGPTGQLSGSPALITGETNAGTYAGDIGIGSLANNEYLIDFTTGQYKIDPRAVTVDPDSGQSKIYGEVDPTLAYATAAATGTTGLVNGDTLSGDISYSGAGQYTSVGAYAFTLGNLSNSNYAIALEASPPTFAITARTVTIDPTSGQSKIYGVVDPTLTYAAAAATGTTGLVNGDTLSGDISYTGAGQYTGVGAYATTLGNLSNSNYNIVLEASPPTFAITAAPLSVTANNAIRAYSAANPVFTYTYTGLVGGDASATFTGALSTTATSGFSAGAYSILQNTLAATGNYTIGTYNPGVFTITAAPVTAAAIPSTVTRVSQDAALNGSFPASGAAIITGTAFGNPPESNTDTPSATGVNANDITSLSPTASGNAFGSKKVNFDSTYISSSQFLSWDHGLLLIDPKLAKRLRLDMQEVTQY